MCTAALVLTAGKQALTTKLAKNEDSRWEEYDSEENQPQTFYCENEESTLTVFFNPIENQQTCEYKTCQIMLVLMDAGYDIAKVSGTANLPDDLSKNSEADMRIINVMLVGMLQDLSKQVGYTL